MRGGQPLGLWPPWLTDGTRDEPEAQMCKAAVRPIEECRTAASAPPKAPLTCRTCIGLCQRCVTGGGHEPKPAPVDRLGCWVRSSLHRLSKGSLNPLTCGDNEADPARRRIGFIVLLSQTTRARECLVSGLS